MTREPMQQKPLTKTIEFISRAGGFHARIDVIHYGTAKDLPPSLPATGVIETSNGDLLQFSGELEGLTAEDFRKKGGRPSSTARDMAIFLAVQLHQGAGYNKPDAVCEVAYKWEEWGYRGVSGTGTVYEKAAKQEEALTLLRPQQLFFTGVMADRSDACAFVFWQGGGYQLKPDGLHVSAPFTFWKYGEENAWTINEGTYHPIKGRCNTLDSQKT